MILKLKILLIIVLATFPLNNDQSRCEQQRQKLETNKKHPAVTLELI